MRRTHDTNVLWAWLAVLAMSVAMGGCDAGRISVPPDGGDRDAPEGRPFDAGAEASEPWADAGPDPCLGVDCSGHGTCVVQNATAVCQCDTGYEPSGLDCVPSDPCEGVTCGANAHCTNGVCECDQGYSGDPYTHCDSDLENQVRQELVDIALAELGSCEGVDDKPYMQNQPGAWCYDFVAWVYSQSSWRLPQPISLPHVAADEVPGTFLPEPGDLIKFTIQHFGMVRSVSADGHTIETVEGNVNSCVVTRTIDLSRVEYFGSLEQTIQNLQ